MRKITAALLLFFSFHAMAGIVPPVVDSTARAAAATADGKAVAAQTTANTAVTDASNAQGDAIGAQMTADGAAAVASSAVSGDAWDATARTAAAAAQTTADTASTNASNALSGSAHDSTARTAAATAQSAADARLGAALTQGSNYTWNTNRVSGTTYTNSTGKTMVFMFRCYLGANAISATLNATPFMSSYGGTNTIQSFTLIIPPSGTYSVTTAAGSCLWFEYY